MTASPELVDKFRQACDSAYGYLENEMFETMCRSLEKVGFEEENFQTVIEFWQDVACFRRTERRKSYVKKQRTL